MYFIFLFLLDDFGTATIKISKNKHKYYGALIPNLQPISSLLNSWPPISNLLVPYWLRFQFKSGMNSVAGLRQATSSHIYLHHRDNIELIGWLHFYSCLFYKIEQQVWISSNLIFPKDKRQEIANIPKSHQNPKSQVSQCTSQYTTWITDCYLFGISKMYIDL